MLIDPNIASSVCAGLSVVTITVASVAAITLIFWRLR